MVCSDPFKMVSSDPIKVVCSDPSKMVFLTNAMQFRIKSSQNKKDLNDVTAAPFLVFFCYWQMRKIHRKRGSCDVIKVLIS